MLCTLPRLWVVLHDDYVKWNKSKVSHTLLIMDEIKDLISELSNDTVVYINTIHLSYECLSCFPTAEMKCWCTPLHLHLTFQRRAHSDR